MTTSRLSILLAATLALCTGSSAKSGDGSSSKSGGGTGAGTRAETDSSNQTRKDDGAGTGGANDSDSSTRRDDEVVSPQGRAVRPPNTPVAPSTPPPGVPSDAIGPAAPSADSPTGPTWSQIRDHTFAERGEFIKGITRLDAQMDQSIATLKSKRSSFTGDPNAWDSEMKRLDDAHAYLKSTTADLAKATSVNWDERREKVSFAWERLQDAYERANEMATP